MNRITRWKHTQHKRPPITLLAVAPLILALSLSACNAQIKQFAANPRHICAGDPVQIEWSVAGSAHIKVVPPSDRLQDGPVDDKGHAVIVPSANTNVALHVTRLFGNPTGSVQEIEVATGTSRREALTASLGDPSATPSCGEGRVTATVHAKRFSPHVKVATVASHPTDGRTYEVQHAGRSAILTPGNVLTVFRGTPLAGDWILSAPVGNGNTCETVPPVLVVDVNTECLAEGTP